MENVISLLKNAQKIAVFMHVRPDGDTIGSSLALRLALRALGKTTDAYCDDALPERFCYLQGFSEVLSGDLKNNYDCFVAVDCSDELRLGKYSSVFLRQKNTVVIDHHKSNTKFAKACLVQPDYAATAILMSEVIDALNVDYTVDLAESLYTGLSTDTGNFSHSNTDKQAFALACRLSACDIDISKITTSLYKSSSKSRMKLLGKVISGMRFCCDDSVTVITVMKSDLAQTGAAAQDTEGFIDYAIGIQGVEVACCLLQHSENSYKVSLRSKGLDVCKIAVDFGGGGHTLASGCMINGFYEDVVDKLVRAIQIHQGR